MQPLPGVHMLKRQPGRGTRWSRFSGGHVPKSQLLVLRGPPGLISVFPTSTIVAAPYLLLVLPVALLNSNDSLAFIAMLVALAVLGSAVPEVLLARVGPVGQDWARSLVDGRHADRFPPRLGRVAVTVAVVSIGADLLGAAQGRGSIFTQVSGVLPTSGLVLASSLFDAWSVAAVALLFAASISGGMRSGRLLVWILALVMTQVAVASFTGITAPLFGFVGFVAFFLLLVGAVRLRLLLVVAALVLLVWPTVFEVRNELRSSGGVLVDQSVTSLDRLRFDQQVARAEGLPGPRDIGQPSVAEAIRFGLVPRLLDPDRGIISTGFLINSYFGGTNT